MQEDRCTRKPIYWRRKPRFRARPSLRSLEKLDETGYESSAMTWYRACLTMDKFELDDDDGSSFQISSCMTHTNHIILQT